MFLLLLLFSKHPRQALQRLVQALSWKCCLQARMYLIWNKKVLKTMWQMYFSPQKFVAPLLKSRSYLLSATSSWRLDYDPESPVNLPWWPHSLFFQPSQRVTRSDCLFCLTMCGLEVRLVYLLWARCLVLASCAWIHLHLPGPFVMNSPQQWTLLSQFMCSQSAFSVPPLMRVTGA